MLTVLKVLASVIAVGFVLVGVAFWAAPELAAAQLGMTLLSGAGLSSQIADFASFFIAAGACIGLGLSSGNRLWFYPPVMLLALAIFGRVLAWAAHGAALTLDFIAVEVVVVSLLVLLARVSPAAPDKPSDKA